MELWWTELDVAHKVFYAIAIATSALLVLQLIASFFGMDGDADIDIDHDTGGLISLRTVTAFLTGFGWGGVVSLEAGLGLVSSVLIGLACGGGLTAAILFLMRAIYSMRYEGTLDYRNAIGNAGSAYIPIPAKMSGPGQVEVLVQGRLCVVAAFTRSEQRIAARQRVRVVDTLDQQTLLVEPIDVPSDN